MNNRISCRWMVRAAVLMAAIFAVQALAESAPEWSGTHARVVDGDTLELAGRKVRLHGIDAPERGQMCQNEAGARYGCGAMATEWLRDLVKGQQVRCVALDTDRYGRIVAKCYAQGMDVGAALVLTGRAMAFRRYSQEYVTLEAVARGEKAGFWQGVFDNPKLWR